MKSKLLPRKQGFYIFCGVRHHSRPGNCEHICAPVQVVEVWVGRRKELAVALLGRATKWPVATFEGTWEELALDADDGFAEFEAFWPALEGPDGIDRFAQYPVSGEPDKLIDDKRATC